MTIALLTILCAAGVAWANGANDVSKGVATLVGSRLASYRQALTWGTVWTVVGAVAAVALTSSLLRTFSTGLIDGAVSRTSLFPLAVAAGAFAWVLMASFAGLPVSTTHALTGAIVGAALAADGIHGVRWGLVVRAVAVPLGLSPFLAAGLSYAVHALTCRRLSAAARYCVCVTERSLLPLAEGLGGAAAASRQIVLPVVVVDEQGTCATEETLRTVRVTDAAHWVTGAALSFARGLNDTPKIVALGLIAASSLSLSSPSLYVVGAAMMGGGSFFAGRRVTKTLAERVTAIEPLEGLSASAVAATLVFAASFLGLPVSTTHVASGAIIGVGLSGGSAGVRWTTVSQMATAWLITLPVSGAVAATTWILAARMF